jgi:PAS domain S-box-containing protein
MKRSRLAAVVQTGEPFDEELLRLFDLSVDLFCVAGFDGYFKRVNRAWERTLGYTQEEMLATHHLEITHPDDVEPAREALAQLAEGKDVAGFEARVICADGSVRWLEWNTRTRLEKGFVYGVARDVTERRIATAELSALRRVATLVADGVEPEDLFAVVAEEVARVVDLPLVRVMRYEPDGTALECASFSTRGPKVPFGKRSSLEGTSVLRLVRESSEAARIDDYSGLEGEIAEIARRSGIRSAVGSPIIVAGRLWGAVVASSTEQLPEGAEARLADFTELVATAIANAESREALGRLADEQATLRRMATLVAQGVRPGEVFSAVCEEVGHLVGSDMVAVARFEHDPPAIVVVGVGRSIAGIPIGTRRELDDALASTQVYRTARSARIDARDWASASGPIHEAGRRLRLASTVASPIVVEGHLWGTMSVSAEEPLPPGTEDRLEKFSELVATAIANAESREAIARLAAEQAALRRVATLVAQGVAPADVFSAVSEEVHGLFGLDQATVGRFDPDGPAFVVLGVAKDDERIPIGSRWEVNDLYVSTKVFRTGRPTRVDERDLASVGGPIAEKLRRQGFISQVASPIVVEGRLWGAMTVTAREPLPFDAEERLEKFSDLVATAIANAESRSELAASRRRIVAASDEARRRIERDLHDGTQQRLVSLGLAVNAAEVNLPSDRDDLRTELSRVATGLADAVVELQEISRGIHPPILSQGGLGPALRALGRRSAIPVELDVSIGRRLPEPVEVAAYYVASEALANATKHAQASHIKISVAARDGGLLLSVRDDGVGGADPVRGSGLVGLTDRVEALGGSLHVRSGAGAGTQIAAELPLEHESASDAD